MAGCGGIEHHVAETHRLLHCQSQHRTSSRVSLPITLRPCKRISEDIGEVARRATRTPVEASTTSSSRLAAWSACLQNQS